ncbi:MAG: hypothetical protein WBG92_12570 [Thiohalocapsa sp.]
MNTPRKFRIKFTTAALFVPPLVAPMALYAADVSEIELRRLLEPTPSELAQEAAGRIYIYDGLRDTDIDLALSEQFDRVEHMMFIRTKKTDKSGDVKRDDKTGAVEVEDDGC